MISDNKVSEYFNDDSARYNAAYGGSNNLKSFIFNERKRVVLGMFDLKGGRVLDLGCGPAVYTDVLSARGYAVYGVDSSVKMIEMARQKAFPNAIFSVGNADKLQFEDRYFDGILCVGVLEYLDNIEKTVAEVARVTRPGGTVIFTAPNGSSLLNKIDSFLRSLLKSLYRILKIGPLKSVIDHAYEANLLYRRDMERISVKYGLIPESSRFHIFRISFLNKISPRLALFLAKKFNSVSNQYIGINYILKCRKQ